MPPQTFLSRLSLDRVRRWLRGTPAIRRLGAPFSAQSLRFPSGLARGSTCALGERVRAFPPASGGRAPQPGARRTWALARASPCASLKDRRNGRSEEREPFLSYVRSCDRPFGGLAVIGMALSPPQTFLSRLSLDRVRR